MTQKPTTHVLAQDRRKASCIYGLLTQKQFCIAKELSESITQSLVAGKMQIRLLEQPSMKLSTVGFQSTCSVQTAPVILPTSSCMSQAYSTLSWHRNSVNPWQLKSRPVKPSVPSSYTGSFPFWVAPPSSPAPPEGEGERTCKKGIGQ